MGKLIPIFLMIAFNAYAEDCRLPTMDGIVNLNPQCTYKSSIFISKPVKLNCNGAIIDGMGRLAAGIVIDSRGEQLSGVEVRNCVVQGFVKLGIGVGWSLSDGKKQRLMEAENSNNFYSRTPVNTLISGSYIKGVGGVGIYVDDHVKNTVIETTEVREAKGAGIYLEHDSSGTLIRSVNVINNGWISGKPMEPGIAIDGSSDNIIENSVISGNALGGIYLYRNCHEHALKNPESVLRVNGANNNTIRSNMIDGRVGVWVASRMSRNMRNMECGRESYYQDKDVDVVLDEARSNRIINNDFSGPARWGVIIEDDLNNVNGNIFSGPFSDGSILIGSKYRFLVLDKPVLGTLISNNKFPIAQPPRWAYGSK